MIVRGRGSSVQFVYCCHFILPKFLLNLFSHFRAVIGQDLFSDRILSMNSPEIYGLPDEDWVVVRDLSSLSSPVVSAAQTREVKHEK